MSNAVQPTSVARAYGYALGFENVSTGGNVLPQRVALPTPIATAKVGTFLEADYHKRKTITNLTDFYNLYGVCPGFYAARILLPGLGAIPLDVFPIKDAAGATAAEGKIAPTGTATENATHVIKFNGRSVIEGKESSYVVATGDAPAAIIAKQIAAINGNIFAPVTASDGTINCKWSITFDADASGGTFTITIGTETTSAIAYTANAAAVKAAIDALSIGTVTVTLNTDATQAGDKEGFTIEFSGDAGVDYSTVVANIGSLTGVSDATETKTQVAVPINTKLTSKWKGTTANEIEIAIEDNDIVAGITYTITQPTGAGGTHAANLATSLANFDGWITKVVNTFGSETFNTLETFNGVPNVTTGGTGRWNSQVMKPFEAIAGSTESVTATLEALASGRENDMTNCVMPAPNSPCYSWEVAAATARLAAVIANNAPNSTTSTNVLPDIIGPDNGLIGNMSEYTTRDQLIKAGISTCTYSASSYVIEDLCTFRRPATQDPKAIDFKWVRDIDIDMNVYFNYLIQVVYPTMDKTIIPDAVVTTAENCVKPKDVKARIFDMADALSRDLAIIADPQTIKDTCTVAISSVNSRRFDVLFRYERTSCVGILATTANASFYYGS